MSKSKSNPKPPAKKTGATAPSQPPKPAPSAGGQQPTKQPPKQSPKQATRQAQRNQAKGKSSTNLYLLIGAGVVGALVLGYLLFSSLQGEQGIKDVVASPGQDRGHDNSLTYTGDLPPAGGAHFDVWQNCGVYDEVVNPGYGIHAMEHGAVWITYDPAALDADQIAALQEKTRAQTYILMSPFPDQRSPLVLTSWGNQLELESADDNRIDEYIDRYRLGPETPEPGAACSGGVGEPLQG